MNQIAPSFSAIYIKYFGSSELILRKIALILCVIGLYFFFSEIGSLKEECLNELLEKSRPTPLITHFSKFLITEMLAFFLTICVIFMNTLSFIAWMYQSGNGHIIFLTILSFTSAISLLIYILNIGGVNQERFGLAGTGGLSYAFGFVCGFPLGGRKVSNSKENEK